MCVLQLMNLRTCPSCQQPFLGGDVHQKVEQRLSVTQTRRLALEVVSSGLLVVANEVAPASAPPEEVGEALNNRKASKPTDERN